MVRLNPAAHCKTLPLPQPFQFQYGAIKSPHMAKRNAYKEQFQFQYGAIKSLSGAL